MIVLIILILLLYKNNEGFVTQVECSSFLKNRDDDAINLKSSTNILSEYNIKTLNNLPYIDSRQPNNLPNYYTNYDNFSKSLNNLNQTVDGILSKATSSNIL